MEKVLKIFAIIGIIALLAVIVYDIYNDFVVPNLYDKNTEATISYGENIYDMCDNAVIKYITSVRENKKSLKYFIPSIKRTSSKTKKFIENINQSEILKLGDVYIVNDNVYIAEYTVFNDTKQKYKVVIKFNHKKNNYQILYDQLYEEGKGV